MSRSVVARVVGGRAVRDVLQSQLTLDRLQGFEQLLLAVEATIRVIAPVGFELDLAGRDLDQARTQLACQHPSLLLLRLRIGGRARQDRDRAGVTQLVQGELQQQRGVDASRVSHQHGRQAPHDGAGVVEPGFVVSVELDHLQPKIRPPELLRVPWPPSRTMPRSR